MLSGCLTWGSALFGAHSFLYLSLDSMWWLVAGTQERGEDTWLVAFGAIHQAAKKSQLPPSNSSTQSSLKTLSFVPVFALFLAPLVRLIPQLQCPLCCITGRKHLHIPHGPLEVRPFRGFFPPPLSFYLSSGLKANPAASQHCSTQTFTKQDISYHGWQTIFTNNTDTAQAWDLHLWHGWAAGKPPLTSPQRLSDHPKAFREHP